MVSTQSGSSAFEKCAALKWLDMPELKKIETDAFRGTALEAVELPKDAAQGLRYED